MRSTEGAPPPVTIVGTGRSGSGYIAKVLTEAGFPCGHEEWYNPFGIHREGLFADSSWCALAPEFEDTVRNTEVWHQIRNPFDVIASHMKGWSQTDAWWPMKESILLGEPAEDQIGLAMQSVYSAHVMAFDLNPTRVWKLEEVSPKMLSGLLHISEEEAKDAMSRVPTNYNQHGTMRRPQLGPDDLPDNRWKPRIVTIAKRYGYL